jgi:hypothetical protein
VQLPIRVLLHHSPCAPRHQVSCSSSRVVPGAHRVVGPSTHRSSGPRDVHTTVCAASGARAHVTTPSEIFPYYHLNRSICSLSDNKESSCCRVYPINHLKTQRGSNIYIKLPRRRVQSALQINTNFPVGSIITNHGTLT